jgi:hypothetical protein
LRRPGGRPLEKRAQERGFGERAGVEGAGCARRAARGLGLAPTPTAPRLCADWRARPPTHRPRPNLTRPATCGRY